MSLPDQEARALAAAWQLLLDLSSGREKRIPTTTRDRSRDILRHFPLDAAGRWQHAEGGQPATRKSIGE